MEQDIEYNLTGRVSSPLTFNIINSNINKFQYFCWNFKKKSNSQQLLWTYGAALLR